MDGCDQKKKGTNLKTKLLEAKHMSTPNFFYFGHTKSPFQNQHFEHVWPCLKKTFLKDYKKKKKKKRKRCGLTFKSLNLGTPGDSPEFSQTYN